jgi:hypothetical protein
MYAKRSAVSLPKTLTNFDVLLSDLHMPHAGDGFTVVSAMRHTHPKAVTLVLSGYPELDEALSAYRLTQSPGKTHQSLHSAKSSLRKSPIPHPTGRCPGKTWHPYWNMISARSCSMYSCRRRSGFAIEAGQLSYVEPGSRSAWPGCIPSLPTQARDTLPFFVLSLRSGS